MHRLNVAFKAACLKFPGYDVVTTFRSKIYSFLAHSSKKNCQLEEIYDELHSVAVEGDFLRRRLDQIHIEEKNDDDESMTRKIKKIQKVFEVRMVAGSHKAVKAIVADFPALAKFFVEEAKKEVPARKPRP